MAARTRIAGRPLGERCSNLAGSAERFAGGREQSGAPRREFWIPGAASGLTYLPATRAIAQQRLARKGAGVSLLLALRRSLAAEFLIATITD